MKVLPWKGWLKRPIRGTFLTINIVDDIVNDRQLTFMKSIQYAQVERA